MFWSNMATSSNIENILESEDVNLITILEQVEVLQECKAGNRKLLDYLQHSENMQLMIELITQQPLEDLPMGKQYQYPNIACEVLSSDNSFSERITEERSSLTLLFNFFRDSPVPMNPLLASYVSRVLSHIVVRESQNWYTYQKNGTHLVNYLDDSMDDIIGWFLNHLGTSAVCDLLHNMIIKLEDTRKNLIDWLEKGKFVERLMQQLGKGDSDIHEGVSRLVGKILSDYQALQVEKLESDAIFDALKLPSTVAMVLNVIFHKEEICQSSIINGLNVVVALLGITNPQVQPKQMSWVPLDVSNKDLVMDSEVESLIISRFEDLQLVLTKEPKEELTLTSGIVSHRIGKGRLAVLKFYAQILSLRRSIYIDKMVEVGALKYIMDMFWANQHNSFLHRLVENIITHVVLTSQENKGLDFLIYEDRFLENILEKFEDNKCGYRVHLGRMATAFYDATHRTGCHVDVYKRLEKEAKQLCENWEFFIWNTLEDYNTKQKKFLASEIFGGVNPYRRTTQSQDQSPTGEMSSTWGETQAAFSTDFQTDYDVFSATDRFDDTVEVDDGKAKDMFEMFCCERNGVAEDEFCLSDDEKFENVDTDFFSNPDADFSFTNNSDSDLGFTSNPDADFSFTSPNANFNFTNTDDSDATLANPKSN